MTPLKQTLVDSKKREQRALLFGRRNYILVLLGILLMGIGYLLMVGGQQPPDQWNPSEIYGFRRITVSTFFVVCGLVVLLISVFSSPPTKA
ncbi:MAG: DUF3098 domain-containing protein [Chitinophagales bacterium]|nr:DUF3098 domain-containing protein [Chitinophagales bacterium]MDW8428784.1 DUF3098 domain-containing protein [Chitinophagales bacterium]